MAKPKKSADTKGQTVVQKWLLQFAAYDRKFKEWEARAERILKRYRDENREKGKDNSSAKFNILWSNVQTLKPAVFSKIPKADVSRRFRDNDAVGRVASLLLERALEFEVEHYPDYRQTMDSAVLDRFLPGRGTAWARYEPHIRAVAQNLPEDGVEVSGDADAPNEELDYECAPVDYVPWKDFGHTVARTWDEVTAVWRVVYLTREACESRFGEEVGKKIPLDCMPDELKKGEMGGDSGDLYRAAVYEVWDKLKLKALWISKAMPDVLDEKDDPLGLEGFFPCPKPLYSTMTNESLIPIPDFALYQDQAKELDTLADRIQGLINALQVKGVYDASIPALARLFNEGDNGTLIPVTNWQAFAEKNGLAGAIDIVDLKPIYEALRTAFDAVQAVLQQIYDLTGLADIIRGQSDPNETLGAQKIKSQYASLRLRSMQRDVAQFASSLLQLKAQIICGNFAPETILKMAAAEQLNEADLALIPQAMALLIGPERIADPVAGAAGENPMRSFRIEVNSDTMVELDEEEEKTKRMEFLAAMGAFMEKAMPMAEASEELRPLILELWKFSVVAFKVGKSIEGAFDQVIDAMKKQAAQPKPPKQDPEMARVQAEAQANQQRAQADMQIQTQKLQSEEMLSKMKMQMEQQAKMQELQLEARMQQQEMSFMQAFEKWKAELNAMTQVKVAEVKAENMPEPKASVQ